MEEKNGATEYQDLELDVIQLNNADVIATSGEKVMFPDDDF